MRLTNQLHDTGGEADGRRTAAEQAAPEAPTPPDVATPAEGEPRPEADLSPELPRLHGPLVAILNHDDELTRSVCEAFEAEGFRTVGGRVPAPPGGHEEVIAFLEKYDPDVVVFDIVQPYADYVETLRAVRRYHQPRPRAFVLTTTNKRALAKYGISRAVELREPEDLADVTEAVRRAVASNDISNDTE